MNSMKRLPDTEFEIMKVVWENEPPITTNIVMGQLGKEKGWKAPTIMKFYHENSFLSFVNTLYDGKELSDSDIEELMEWAKERRD